MYPRTLLALFVLGLLTIGGTAQQFGASPAHPNAVLTVNGLIPDAHTNDVNVYGNSPLTFHVGTAVSGAQPLLLLAGTLQPGAFPTPWAGSVDLAGVEVIADGYGYSTGSFMDSLAFTPFDLSVSIPYSVAWTVGVIGSIQAVVIDPTNSPFPARNSIAIRLTTGKIETVYAMGDDDFVHHDFAYVSTIEFMGAQRTGLYIGSNGYVTFTAGSTHWGSSPTVFFNGLGTTGNAAVAVAYADLNPGGSASGATYAVIETPQNVTVEFRNQVHYYSHQPAGTFSCFFPLNGWSDVYLYLGGYIAGTNLADDVIIGITDGNSSIGIDTVLSNGLGTGLAAARGTYFSPIGVATDSILEYIPGTIQPAIGTVSFIEMGGTLENACRFAINY